MNETLQNVLIEEIHIDSASNCRKGSVSPSSVFDLAKSIEKNELIQPIVLRTFLEDEETFGKKYCLIAGFRRFAAVKTLDHTHIKSLVHENITIERAQFINFSENLNRKDLNIFEEAQTLTGFLTVLNPETGSCYTEFDIMRELNISRGWLQPRLMLMKMPQEAHRLADEGYLNNTAIRDLNRYENIGDLIAELKRLREKTLTVNEKITLKVIKPTTGAKRNPAIMPKQRKRKECNAVLDWLNEQGVVDHGILRGIAWAAGNISDLELLNDIKKHMDSTDTFFEVPDAGFVRVIEGAL